MSEVKLAGFDLIEKVGEGGMGQVWKARQLSLDRLVAIKLLPPRLSHDPQSIQQIIKEARTAAKLKHPGIVHVYDASEQDGHCCLVMEFVDGYNVGQWISRKKLLSYKDALLVLESVAIALKYAWREAGLIHCDIKPENIMVDCDGTIKVADLGLSLTRDSQGAVQNTDEISGTPGYISPEQVQGDVPLDCRTDIYALGCCLYQMITGVRPFHNLTDNEAMEAQVTSQIPDPREIVPEIPASVCNLIEWMLIKNRDHRLADWDAVLKELHRVQKSSMSTREVPPEGASTMQRRVSSPLVHEEAKGVEPKPVLSRLLKIGVVGAVLVGGALGGLWWVNRKKTPVAAVLPSPVPVVKMATNSPVPVVTPVVKVAPVKPNHEHEISQATNQIIRTVDSFIASGKFEEGINWLETYSGIWPNETVTVRQQLADSLRNKKALLDEAQKGELNWTNCLIEITSSVLSGKYSVASQLVDTALKDATLNNHRAELAAIEKILDDVGALPDKLLKTYEPEIGRNVVIPLVRGSLMGQLVAIQDRKLVLKTMDEAAQVNLRLEEISPTERQARLIALDLPEGNLVRGVTAYNCENDTEAEALLAKTGSPLGSLLIQQKKADSGAASAQEAFPSAEQSSEDAAMRKDPGYLAFVKLARRIGLDLSRREFSRMKYAIETVSISREAAAQADRAMDLYLEAHGTSAFVEAHSDLILAFQSTCGRAMRQK